MHVVCSDSTSLKLSREGFGIVSLRVEETVMRRTILNKKSWCLLSSTVVSIGQINR